jgi:hypothetical protein
MWRECPEEEKELQIIFHEAIRVKVRGVKVRGVDHT